MFDENIVYGNYEETFEKLTSYPELESGRGLSLIKIIFLN